MPTGQWQVGQTNHDADEQAGTVVVDGANVNVNDTNHYGIFIFDVSSGGPAQGATCNAASMEVYLPTASRSTQTLDIHCEDADTPAVAVVSTNNISARARTTEKTTWTASSIGDGWKTSPDFASAVQEVLDRPGFSGTLAVIVKGTITSNFRIRDYTTDSATAAKLNLTWGGSQTITINASADDGQEDGSNGGITLTTTSINTDSTGDVMGFLFRSLAAPQGATIANAYVEVWPTSTDRDSPSVRIRAEGNPADLSTTAYDFSGRTTTTEYVDWSASDIGISAYKSSPDLTAVLQEVVDDAGWAAGDDVAIFFTYNGGGWFRVATQNDTVINKPPRLYVEWTTGGTDHALAGTIAATTTVSGAVVVTRTVAGTAAPTTDATAGLIVTRGVAGSAAATTGATGALDVARTVAGSSAATTDASGALSVTLALAGSADATTDAAAAASVSLALAGETAATTDATGDLTATKALAGQTAATTDATGAVEVAREIAATSAATSGATGALTLAVGLAGETAATSGASGVLDTEGQVTLAGTIAATSDASGAVALAIALAGQTDATSDAAGTLTTEGQVSLAGTIAATSGAVGAPKVAFALGGETAVTSGATALVVVERGLAAGSEATTGADGTLTVEAAIVSLVGSCAATSGGSGGVTMAWALVAEAAATGGVSGALSIMQALVLVGTVRSFGKVGTVEMPAATGMVEKPGAVGTVRTAGDVES